MPNEVTVSPFGNVTRIRDGWEFEHNNPFNVDLFTQQAIFERVPLTAENYADPRDIDSQAFVPTPVKNYTGVVNRATGELLDMRPISKSYQLVPHEVMLREQAQQIVDSPLRNEPVTVIDRLFESGKKAHRTILFDDRTSAVKSRREGTDTVTPRLDVFNSVDMSWAFQVFSGAYRDLCQNTLVFGGEKAYHQKRKHTRNLDTTSLTGKAVLSLDMFTNQRDLMDVWARQGLTSRAFQDILTKTICARPARPSDKEGEEPVNKGLLDYLVYQFQDEAEELGETMWAGYNALTHWSTHTLEKGTKNQKQHDTQRNRADKVRDVLTSDHWRTLEMAAA